MEEISKGVEMQDDNIESTSDSSVLQYSQEEKQKEIYEQHLSQLDNKQLIKGIIIDMIGRDYIVDVGYKGNASIPMNEFRESGEIKIGDELEFYVEEVEDKKGHLKLSLRKARALRTWNLIEEAYKNSTTLEGKIIDRTKGGFIVDIQGILTFLPGSQIDVRPVKDYDAFLDKTLDVKVAKINYQNNNVVVSHRILIEKDLEEQRKGILSQLEEGQILEGFVKNITKFGAFIDLGGVDGLLHITDISWGRVSDPADKLEIGQKVKVIVISFDEHKKRISLGMKQLEDNPWDSLSESVQEGSRVKGRIVNITEYGGFLEVLPGVEGLIHVSELSWSQHIKKPSDSLEVNSEVEAVVLMIDRENKKMSLGIKQLTQDPWKKTDILIRYAPGTIHTGIIRNMTNYGLFLELEEGIDGLIHISDISWVKKISHPSEFTNIGEELKIKVLEIDLENRRISLGIKQLEENPWDTFENIFRVGSVHECTIITKVDKGVLLELPYGVQGFCFNKALKKQNGSYPEIGDKLPFRVIDFFKETKSIILSHSSSYQEDSRTKELQKSLDIETVNKRSTKATIGDVEGLAALKQMEDKNN